MITSTRAFLLAGASALAILASAAEANAETFAFTGAVQTFAATVSGEYAVELLGASGGKSNVFDLAGGLGAEVSGDVFLTAGEDLTLFVGGQGGSGFLAGGGGGGSFVFHGTDVLAVAGGGGGGAINGGGPGLAGTSGGTGEGQLGGKGGMGGNGGRAGDDAGGGGGAGVNTGPAGYGGNGLDPGVFGGFGGKFPNGGGGGSYLVSLFTDQVLKAGVNSGDGSISIDLLKAVPEPSTWAMMLAGFAGLGWLAQARRRKTSPA